MASITFPSDRPHFYSTPFDANSSFQVNPLSSHPPRISDPSPPPPPHNAVEPFPKSGDEKIMHEDDGDDDVELDDQPKGRIRKEEVWNEMFLTSNGRDKAFKLMQYSIRLILLVHNSVAASRQQSRLPLDIELTKRLTSTADGLSFTRKLLLLFNWLSPLSTITAQQSVPFSSEQSSSKPNSQPFLYALLHTPPPVLLEFVHALADDAVTYYKLGLVGKRLGQRAERFSDWCWLLATLVGLVENGMERQMIGRLQSEVENRLYAESMNGATAKSNPRMTNSDEQELKRLRRQHYWLRMTRAKLVMDLIFVSYDLFNIKRGREPVKTLTGLTAAVLSSAKLFDRHKTWLLKKMLTS